MIVGIVGSEAAKFTEYGKAFALAAIRSILARPEVKVVVSGGCHLGGIDIWAIEIAKELGLLKQEFIPEHLSWEWYKKRNIRIAVVSDEVHCITVDKLPPNYTGMRFKGCYHCGTSNHVKSGGCWTMKYARKFKKVGKLHIIPNIG